MTEIRQEVLNYIDEIPDTGLDALRPILRLLVNDTFIIDTDLTDEEKNILVDGRKEYVGNPQSFVPLPALE